MDDGPFIAGQPGDGRPVAAVTAVFKKHRRVHIAAMNDDVQCQRNRKALPGKHFVRVAIHFNRWIAVGLCSATTGDVLSRTP